MKAVVYCFVFYSYAGASNNRPIWLGRLQCNSNDNELGSCGRADRAIGSVVHCMDHSLNNDAAVNCNRTTSSHGEYLIILRSPLQTLLFYRCLCHPKCYLRQLYCIHNNVFYYYFVTYIHNGTILSKHKHNLPHING